MKNNPKILVFTSAYSKRPYMIRQCILNSLQQTYKNFVHSINVTMDKDNKSIQDTFWFLFNDLQNDERIKINYSLNEIYRDRKYYFSHFNNMNTIKFIEDWDSFDLFVKMDDDDIYKKNYLQNIVKGFNESSADIVSSHSKCWIRNNNLSIQYSSNLGGNPDNTDFGMPMTFAFNKRALDVISSLKNNDMKDGYDDFIWRKEWTKNGLTHKLIDNENDIIWHRHKDNASKLLDE